MSFDDAASTLVDRFVMLRANTRTADNAGMRAIGKFLVLTFVTTWALWVWVMLRNAPQGSLNGPPALALGGPVFLLGVFAPGLVAVALTAWDNGRAAVAALLGRIVHWRVDLRFYAFALLLMPAIKLTVAALYRVAVGTWPVFGETRPGVLVAATILSTIGQAGEELGWRGYLLPHLTERVGLALASLVVGLVWAVWHLPLFFALGAETYHQSFPFYLLQIIAYSVVLAWLYWQTGGSLLLTMFMHSAFNNMKDIVPSAGVPAGSSFTLHATFVLRFTVLLLWVVGIVLLTRMRGVARLSSGPNKLSFRAAA